MVPILVSRFAALSLADTHFDRGSTIRLSRICGCSYSKAPVDECRLPAALVVPAKSLGANENNEYVYGRSTTSTCTWFRPSCEVCDVMSPVRDPHVMSPGDLSYKQHFRAAHNLRNNKRVMSEFSGTKTIPAVYSMD